MNRILLNSRRITQNFKLSKLPKFYSIPYEEQYESRDNESETKNKKIISYGKFIEGNNSLTHKERRDKIQEFLNQYG